MNTVERLKSILKERKIPVSKLERECGFANGYISQLRKGSIPDDRLKIICEYLDLSIEFLTTGKEPTFSNMPNFQPDHLELATLYSKLNEEQKKTVMTMLRSLALQD